MKPSSVSSVKQGRIHEKCALFPPVFIAGISLMKLLPTIPAMLNDTFHFLTQDVREATVVGGHHREEAPSGQSAPGG